MPILSIKATKPSSDTRLGFTCRKAKDGTSLSFIVTSVDPLGLFGGTDLRGGQQLLRINGISLNEVDVDGIKAILSSLPAGGVSLIVKCKVSPSDGAIFTFTLSGDSINAKMKTEYEIPKILKDASVPMDQWYLIHTLIEHDLMPTSLKCFQACMAYTRAMRVYPRQQQADITNVALEQKTHMKGVYLGILHNNVTLHAMAIKDQVNSILAKYHTIAVLAYDRIPLPGHAALSQSDMMIAVGFNFLSMNYLTVTAMPSPSASPDSLEQIVQATAVLNC